MEADIECHINETVRIAQEEKGESRDGKIRRLVRRHDRIRQEIVLLRALDNALADALDRQISLSDPDARAMTTSARYSGVVGDNVQSAVDTEPHIITHDVTNQSFDRNQLSPMAIAVRDALQRAELVDAERERPGRHPDPMRLWGGNAGTFQPGRVTRSALRHEWRQAHLVGHSRDAKVSETSDCQLALLPEAKAYCAATPTE